MEQSSYIQYLEERFPKLVLAINRKLNDTKNPLTYRHKTMLTPEFSLDGKWSAVSSLNTFIMADIVAMDSQLPLKSRDTIETATGDIPKMGMEMWLNENQLSKLDLLEALAAADPTQIARLLSELFKDLPKVIAGIYERNEAMFLQALSTGMTLVSDDDNTGIGIRLDFGYKNKRGVSALWSDPVTAKPFNDMNAVRKDAMDNGDTITKFMIDPITMNRVLESKQAAQLVAYSKGIVTDDAPDPDIDQVNAMAQKKYGFVFEVVDRNVKYQKNGKNYSFRPWESGMVIGLTTDKVGALVWANLAENKRRVPGVIYQNAEDYILVSIYRKNSPVSEHTNSQARVVPVISNVQQIYQLNTNELEA